MDIGDLIKKKSSKPAEHKDIKLNILKELRQAAMGSIGNDIEDLKKVSVVAKDEKGLKEGLDKAEELVGKGEGAEGENPAMFSEHPRSEETLTKQDKHYDEDMSLEEIDACIAELEAKKAELLKQGE
jgi:hypothetical protein